MKESWIFRRGDLYLADLGKSSSSKYTGVRPVILIQNNIGNCHCETVTVIPLVACGTKWKRHPTHYIIRKVKGLRGSFIVPCEQIYTCDKTCMIRYLGRVTKSQLHGIDGAVKIQLGYIATEICSRKGRQQKNQYISGSN